MTIHKLFNTSTCHLVHSDIKVLLYVFLSFRSQDKRPQNEQDHVRQCPRGLASSTSTLYPRLQGTGKKFLV